MNGTFSRATICGLIEEKPLMRYTGGSRPMVTVLLSVDEEHKGERRRHHHNVTLWDRHAEVVSGCEIGDKLLVEGVLDSYTWTDRRNNKQQHATSVRGLKVQILESKSQVALPLGEKAKGGGA